jgi:hypothetical protein
MNQSSLPIRPLRSTVAAALIIPFLFAISGCSRAAPAPADEAPRAAAAAASAPAAQAPVATAGGALAGSIGGRMVISEATLSLRASPDEAAEAASQLVTARGGYVASKETIGADGSAARVELVLRVPARALEEVLSDLRKKGTLLAESQSGHDVTDEYTDTEAQLRAKRSLEERLLTIVASAKSVKEMLEVEAELLRVRTDIERLDGRTRSLAGQVAFATIRLSLVAPSQPVVADGELGWSRLRRAFTESRSVFLHVVTGIIVVSGALLPLAGLGGVGLAGARLVRRRRRSALQMDHV